MKKNKNQAALGFIFITMLIDVIGWGIIIPVIPGLIEELIQGDISEAAKVGGWITFAYAITQFVFAPLIGNLSDQYGRRPIILISLLGFTLDYILLALAPSITWLFIGRIIAGITGASITTASAYIADISTIENRAKNVPQVHYFGSEDVTVPKAIFLNYKKGCTHFFFITFHFFYLRFGLWRMELMLVHCFSSIYSF